MSTEKIKIKTRDFDEMEISPKDIITFPNGIFAFEEFTQYVLISPLGNGKFPAWLQCVDNPNLCFIVFSPLEFCPNYAVAVPEEETAPLELNGENDITFYAIAVIPENHMDATVNLKSPIIVNNRNNKAVQAISTNDYPIKFPVFAKEGQ